MSNTFMDAVGEVAEVMQFENWLRFYFVTNEGEELYVRIPEKAQDRIREDHPQYFKLVEMMTDKPIDYNASVNNVCEFVVQTLDNGKYRKDIVPNVFDSKEFQLEMHLFNSWLQMHESQLDDGFLDFNKWMEIFGEWKNSEPVRKYFEQIRQKQQFAAAMQPRETHSANPFAPNAGNADTEADDKGDADNGDDDNGASPIIQ